MSGLKDVAKRSNDFLLTYLRESNQPATVQSIIDYANTPEGRKALGSFDIRSSIWSLVEQGKIEFSPDRKVRLV